MASSKRKATRKKKRRKSGKASRQSFDVRDLVWMGGICLLVAIAYGRAVGFDFVNWDDDYNIWKNPDVQRLNWESVVGIFTSDVLGNYNPLSTLTFAIENGIAGLNPKVFHTTNIVLHAIASALVFRLTRMLGPGLWASLVAAAVFAIHPMKVESVAWVTERKDVLFGVFYIGAMITYVKWRAKKSGALLAATLLLFLLSLLSKIQAVALPLSLLCIDYLLDKKKMGLKDLLNASMRKWYYFAMSLGVGILGVVLLKEQGSLGSNEIYSFLERLVLGAYSYCVYIVKFFVPYRISPLYPYPNPIPWMAYAAPVGVAGLIALTIHAYRKDWRALVFGIAFFTVNVMFVLQVLGAGQAFLADRFTYIPYFGLAFPLVFYAQKLSIAKKRFKTIVPVAGIAWLIALAAINWSVLPIWKNSGNLWTHALKYYESALPYRNRAQYYREQQQYDLALPDYNRSIALKEDADVINSRARLYFDTQQWAKALEDYNKAIALDPESGEFRINRGAAHANMGNLQAALQDMTAGIQLEPDFANGYKNRALLYSVQGQQALARQDYLIYLQLEPYDDLIWYELGRVYNYERNFSSALEAFTSAIRLNPSEGRYYVQRALTHRNLGSMEAARNDLSRAEQLGAPIDPQVRSAIQ